jgi:hypothetical protein
MFVIRRAVVRVNAFVVFLAAMFCVVYLMLSLFVVFGFIFVLFTPSLRFEISYLIVTKVSRCL